VNHRTPEWEVAPDPTNYDPAVPGPYTPPAEPDPFPHKPRRHGALVALGALGGLGVFALWIGATSDPEVVEIPNSAVKPSYDPGLYTPEPQRSMPVGKPLPGKPVEKAPVLPTIADDPSKMYVPGKTMAYGTWATTGSGPACFWSVDTPEGPLVGGPADEVPIEKGDRAFLFESCNPFVRIR
jgi:hypothetical protein